jgi:hypothetical protein
VGSDSLLEDGDGGGAGAMAWGSRALWGVKREALAVFISLLPETNTSVPLQRLFFVHFRNGSRTTVFVTPEGVV